MWTFDLPNGQRISPALMGIGAAGMVVCAGGIAGNINWWMAAFTGLAFLVTPHILYMLVGARPVRLPAPVAEVDPEPLPEPAPPMTLHEPGKEPRALDRTEEMTILRAGVQAFLKKAIERAGPDAKRVPRYNKLGYSTDEWEYFTDALGAALNKVNRQGTWVRGYENLEALRRAVTLGLPLVTPLPRTRALMISRVEQTQTAEQGQ